VNYQNIPGVATTASYVIPRADVLSGLGRPLSAGARGTAQVALIAPSSLYVEDRLNQLNLSFTRLFRFGGNRLQPRIELANALNAATINTLNTTWGPQWNYARGILAPRLIKFGVQFDF